MQIVKMLSDMSSRWNGKSYAPRFNIMPHVWVSFIQRVRKENRVEKESDNRFSFLLEFQLSFCAEQDAQSTIAMEYEEKK